MQRTTSIERVRRPAKSGSLRRVRVGLWTLLVLMTCGDMRLRAAPAGTVHYADLQSVIPLDQFSIVQTSPTTREFRYTHIISNLGDGPLDIRPEYDPATDTARGFQRLYTHDATGTWSIVDEFPIVGIFQFHPEHGHYHFPLAQFGLFQVAPDGSVGAPVAVSPKIGFCIGDSLVVDGSLAHVGVFGYFDSCGPTTPKGISVGWGDLYDRNDAGQSIDATGVPDGTYWFHSIVDPFNYFVEKDKANNITDVKLQISGNTVTVLGAAVHPSSQPPGVTLTAPAAGAVSGSAVTMSATASDPSGITSVQFLLDGAPVGQAVTAAPYSVVWDSTASPNGTHYLSAQASAASGFVGTARAVTVTVSNGGLPPPPPGSLAVDTSVFTHGTGGTATTGAFSTAASGDLLLAFVASDGPTAVAAQSVTVSGAGLSWGLVRRTNARFGTAEVWKATAPSPLTNVTVTSTQASGSYHQLLSVIAFKGSGGTGATASGSGVTGAPSVSLTATQTGSFVYGVGNDWDNAIGRVVGANQTMIHQWVDTTVGDTFWLQASSVPTTGGTLVRLDDTSPTSDQWNFTAVEIVPSAAPAALTISNVLVTNRTSSSATVTWTTNVEASSRVDYGPDASYGTAVFDATPVLNHAVILSGLTPSTTYHYKITSQDGPGNVATAGDFVFSTASVSDLACSVTAPTNGATVSGVISVTADAVSSASVSGVQFRLDGNVLGAEDTLIPYATSWDTRTASGGTHTLTAVARDPTGNSVTSAPVTVTVSNLPPPSPGGLVAAYSFNAGSGQTAADASGTGNTGTIVNATWGAAGRYGAALSFAGTGSVTVADAPSLDLARGMTLEAWVRPSATQGSAWRTVLLKERSAGLCYSLYANSTSKKPQAVINTGGNDRSTQGASTIPVNAWTHLAATYDGTTLRIYVNGSLKQSTNVPGTLVTSNGALRIGGNSVWGEYFRGLIDEVRVYNRALSVSEIQSDMSTPVQ
jgi:hypothetical protein